MNYALAQEQRIGMRETNQDYAMHDTTEKALLLVVADGMGGYYGGELAAEIAVGSMCHSFGSEARPELAEPGAFLERAIARAHEAIRGYALEQQLPDVPRTVIVACVVQDGRAWWNHVGDARLYLVRGSRIEAQTRDHTPVQALVDARLYLVRGGRIEEQTRDHTPVQALVDAGELPAEQAYSHPESNLVLQSLGAPTAPEAGPGASARLQKDDILLLCSDGFWGPLRSSQLIDGLKGPSLRQSILELSDTAERRAGAHGDNLTVLAMRWQGETESTTTGDANLPDGRDNPAPQAGAATNESHRPETGIGG